MPTEIKHSVQVIENLAKITRFAAVRLYGRKWQYLYRRYFRFSGVNDGQINGIHWLCSQYGITVYATKCPNDANDVSAANGWSDAKSAADAANAKLHYANIVHTGAGTSSTRRTKEFKS